MSDTYEEGHILSRLIGLSPLIKVHLITMGAEALKGQICRALATPRNLLVGKVRTPEAFRCLIFPFPLTVSRPKAADWWEIIELRGITGQLAACIRR